MTIAVIQIEDNEELVKRIRAEKEVLESEGHKVEWYYYEKIGKEELECEIEDLSEFVYKVLVYGEVSE